VHEGQLFDEVIERLDVRGEKTDVALKICAFFPKVLLTHRAVGAGISDALVQDRQLPREIGQVHSFVGYLVNGRDDRRKCEKMIGFQKVCNFSNDFFLDEERLTEWPIRQEKWMNETLAEWQNAVRTKYAFEQRKYRIERSDKLAEWQNALTKLTESLGPTWPSQTYFRQRKDEE
jgi:hypothetical protein